MPTCSVPYCVNATGKDTRLTFHEFPHETPLFLNKWLENIGRLNWRPGHRSVVCCEHFERDDFDRQGRLRIGSFPSKFPEPPFRKKKKHGTESDVGVSVTLPSTREYVPSSKVPLPIEKQVPGIIKGIVVNESESSQDVIHVKDIDSLGKELHPQRIGLASTVSSENFPNENRMEMKIDQNNSLKSKMTELSSKSSQGFEIPKKRKILEESQPVSVTPGQVASCNTLMTCRVCGQTSNSNINIFGTEGRRLCLVQLLNKCLHLEVSEADSLPHCVCKSCIPRLRSCFELITTCERTNNSLTGKDGKHIGIKDPDSSVIHSKPVQPQHACRGNRRVLLLEMSLREGIPVKSMITQAIQELTLRLQPKEIRETKPQGRIMFLDLQGGTEAFPEQMKKAISMLFPSSQVKKTLAATETKSIPILVSSPSKAKQEVMTKGSSPCILNTAKLVSSELHTETKPSGSTPTNVLQSPQTKVPDLNLSSQSKTNQPVQPKTLVSKLSSSTSTCSSPLVLNSIVSNVSPPSTNQNLFVQTTPVIPAVPLAILPSSAAIRIAALPGSLPPGVVPQIIRLPSSNLISTQPKSASVEKATNSLKITAFPDDDHIYEDDPMPLFDSNSNSGEEIVPPLVLNKQTLVPNNKPEPTLGNGLPLIDIAKMKDKVIKKINNAGKHIKLGDKIMGIIVRNSDSKDDIKKKLHATFVGKNDLQKDSIRKERAILPKGSEPAPVGGTGSIASVEIVGGKKLKDRLVDVPSTVDHPSFCFDRRNSRKLGFSFMWRRTGFLVSSYQKLFTWQMGTDESGNIDPIITCRVCKFTAKSKTEIESHLIAHPELQCSICWKYFLTDAKVFEHMSVIHSIPAPAEYVSKKKTHIAWRHNFLRRAPLKQYQCSRCDRRFKVKDGLKRHFGVCKERTLLEKVVAISGSNLFCCSVCNRSFPSSEALQEHVLIHAKRTTWLCDVCGIVLKSSSNYRTHVAKHDENAHDYQFQCVICKKRFKLANRYDDHMKKHEVHQTYICSSCGKSFNTLNGLRQHEILHGERKQQCRFCPSRFHRRDHLRVHEATHLKLKPLRAGEGKTVPGTGRMFTCRFCVHTQNTDVKFSNMRELMKHYSDAHEFERGSIPGVKKFECDRCNRSFVNSTLLRHHHMWHAGLRPYNCSSCGAGFMIKERLRNHEMTHTNERPFKCQICGKGFRSRNVLKQHKAIHNDPSEFYKCDYCKKRFSRIDNLRTHIRVHTGEKPWKCLHCHRQFRLRSECTKHVQNVHQISAEDVFNSIETLVERNNPASSHSESESAESAIAVIAGITTVQDMELLIKDEDDIEECDGDEDSLQ